MHMPYMVWESLLNSPQPTAAGTALANSTTLTDISVAPNFTLPDLNGKPHTLADFRGKKVLLVTWASW